MASKHEGVILIVQKCFLKQSASGKRQANGGLEVVATNAARWASILPHIAALLHHSPAALIKYVAPVCKLKKSISKDTKAR